MPTHLERIRAEVVGIVTKDPLGNLQADRCTALCHPWRICSSRGHPCWAPKQARVGAFWHLGIPPSSPFLFFL